MRRALIHYWRTNLAVLAGAAVATAVLTGALMVGDSVRGSLRDLALDRLGETGYAVAAERAFREELAAEIAADAGVATAPLLMIRASGVHADSGARASRVALVGVDERFAALYPQPPALDALAESPGVFPPVVLNESLAAELGAAVGDAVLFSFQQPADVPRETLVGRQQAGESLQTLRFTVAGTTADRGAGGFTLTSQQARPLNAFADLGRLQRRLFGRENNRRVNLLLAGARSAEAEVAAETEVAAALDERLRLADLGLELELGAGAVVLESREFVLGGEPVRSARELAAASGAAVQPTMTYLANEIRAGSRSVPYSTVTAIDPVSAPGGGFELVDGTPAPALADDEILLNRWAADDLGAAPGDEIELDYYELGARDELSTATARFRLAGVVAMRGAAIDPTLTPEFPGLDDADDMSAWNPPFPVDLDAIRPEDEAYWDDYRSVPKAFVAERRGRELWRSRFGDLTSLRLLPAAGEELEAFAERLRSELPKEIDAAAAGLALRPIREESLRAAEGATDFAQLFLALSMFLIGSAALLVGLLFRLGVEQRATEVGLLRAVGYRERSVRRGLLLEGVLLAAVGGVAGLGGALAYAALMLTGLRTWWLPAVGTPVLELHVEPLSLAIGWLASVAVVTLTIWWTLRRLRGVATPRLLAGSVETDDGHRRRRLARPIAWAAFALAAAFIALALLTGATSSPALAFGTGGCLLAGGLALFAHRCGGGAGRANALGKAGVLGMGARNTGRNRSRSILSVALVASASFMMVAVAANQGGHEVDVTERDSGAGGFTLTAESDSPVYVDLNRPERRLEAGFSEADSGTLDGVEIIPFRLLPGEDVSCLNLYRPERPRLLGVTPEMVHRGGFGFRSTSEPAENPWTLLDAELEPGVIPAIGDYNSVLWILHSGLGKDVVINDESGGELKLRFVGLLAKSVFQSEILISEENFLAHFPSRTGYSYFLADPPPARLGQVATALESSLGRFGFDATPTAEKLAAFSAVERTYLATFQTLGGLGLVLGTFGLGIVLLRNVIDRRGELATLRAFGYRRVSLAGMVLAENATLLLAGIAIGTLAGVVAVSPNLVAGGEDVPWLLLAATLGLVFLAGTLSSALAVIGTVRVPLLAALKAD